MERGHDGGGRLEVSNMSDSFFSLTGSESPSISSTGSQPQDETKRLERVIGLQLKLLSPSLLAVALFWRARSIRNRRVEVDAALRLADGTHAGAKPEWASPARNFISYFFF